MMALASPELVYACVKNLFCNIMTLKICTGQAILKTSEAKLHAVQD